MIHYEETNLEVVIVRCGENDERFVAKVMGWNAASSHNWDVLESGSEQDSDMLALHSLYEKCQTSVSRSVARLEHPYVPDDQYSDY